MLILTRKTEQGIVFDGGITVRVLSIEGERVKLGITAPDSVLVLREELCRPDQLPDANRADHAPRRLQRVDPDRPSRERRTG
ncbi:MAG: carbon storage regulator [Chloroflexi bacterium]|nr:carbon storage regulator [Chloroflexota bacterium]